MLDARYFRNHLADLQTAMQARNFPLDVAAITALEEKRKAVQVRSEQLQKERNDTSKKSAKPKLRGRIFSPC